LGRVYENVEGMKSQSAAANENLNSLRGRLVELAELMAMPLAVIERQFERLLLAA
jgi:hypothetical protein